MRMLDTSEITKAVAELCIRANQTLPCEVENALKKAEQEEYSVLGRQVLHAMVDNLKAAEETRIPICQDTGMAVIFIELGQEVCLTGALLEDAVNEGVRQGYREGYLRCSVVGDPLRRVNTGDNTPCILHLKMVAGDKVKITVAPKGFGSENMSAMKMFTPSAGREQILDFIVNAVKTAGSNPCPPVIVGVGLGGDFEKCAELAKWALCREEEHNKDPFYAELEEEALRRVNKLGIGPQGFGGRTTALGVRIEAYPTHIAGLPAAVNMGCHVTRHAYTCI